MNIPTQGQMQNTQKKQTCFSLNKINKKIDILCLGQVNCNYTDFLMQYTLQSKDDNEIQNIYVKKINNQVVFFHQWKSKQQLHIVQHYDGIIFFVDLIHHLNNTTETILKSLETISYVNGTNIFRIPIILIALNGSKLKSTQFQNQRKRLSRKVNFLLDQGQILYYSGGNKQNFKMITQKIETYVNQIFQDDPQSIKSTWETYYKLYGYGEIFQPYWTEIRILYFSLVQRLSGQKAKLENTYGDEPVIRNGRSFLKKLW